MAPRLDNNLNLAEIKRLAYIPPIWGASQIKLGVPLTSSSFDVCSHLWSFLTMQNPGLPFSSLHAMLMQHEVFLISSNDWIVYRWIRTNIEIKPVACILSFNLRISYRKTDAIEYISIDGSITAKGAVLRPNRYENHPCEDPKMIHSCFERRQLDSSPRARPLGTHTFQFFFNFMWKGVYIKQKVRQEDHDFRNPIVFPSFVGYPFARFKSFY